MKALCFALGLVFILACQAEAQTVTNNLAWTIDNPGSPEPATDFRVEENVVGVWTARGTVPVTQLTFADAGRPLGTYSYRIMPVRAGLDGAPSNTVVCGAVPPDTTVTLTCSPVVTP